MAQFNPANSRIRMALETVPTYQPLTGFIDHTFLSADLSNESENRNDESIYPGAQRPRGLLGKRNANGSMEVNLAPEQYDKYISSAQQKVATTTPGGATLTRRHKMGPSQATSVLPSYSMLFSKDDDLPQRLLGAQTAGMTFAWDREDGFLKTTFDILAARGDYWPDATVVTDPSASTKPQLFGLPEYAVWIDPTAADRRVYIKVADITDIADGIITVLVKVSTAASYGTFETTVTIGNNALTGLPQLNNLYDSTSEALLGTFDTPIQVYFPNSTNIAVDDEWFWTAERTVWSPSISTAPVFNEIYANVFIGGDQYCVNNFSLSVEIPLQARFCLGGRDAIEVRQRGQRVVNLEIGRDYLDTSMVKRLERGEPFTFEAIGYSGEEIEAGFQHYVRFFCPLVVPGGRVPGVEGNAEMTENIQGTCHPDADNATWPDDVNIEIQDSLTTVAA